MEPDKPKRKSGLRLTKQQRAWQEKMLADRGLQEEFKPSSQLADEIAMHFIALRNILLTADNELAAYKSKPILALMRERWFK
jgi:hypothetical protein